MPEAAPQPEAARLPPGAYVAPPQTGVQVESSRQTTIGGLAIRFPEMRLALPSIELPRRITKVRGAHMELDHAVADYRALPTQPVAHRTYAGVPQAAPARGPAEPERAPGQPETAPEADDIDAMRRRCELMAEQLRQKEQLLDRKLSQLEAQLKMLQGAPCDAALPPCAAPRRDAVCPPQPPAEVIPAPPFELLDPSQAEQSLGLRSVPASPRKVVPAGYHTSTEAPAPRAPRRLPPPPKR